MGGEGEASYRSGGAEKGRMLFLCSLIKGGADSTPPVEEKISGLHTVYSRCARVGKRRKMEESSKPQSGVATKRKRNHRKKERKTQKKQLLVLAQAKGRGGETSG